MSRGISWFQASLPAAFAVGVIGAALGFLFFGWMGLGGGGLACVFIFEWFWFRRALPQADQLLNDWKALDAPLLTRSWTRAFEEQERFRPPPPRLVISQQAGGEVMLWRVRSGESVLILGQTWLTLHSESELREIFRDASLLLKHDDTWHRSAKAWFVVRLSAWVPFEVFELLWGRSSAVRATPLQALLALPAAVWLQWVESGESAQSVKSGATLHWARRIALLQTVMKRDVIGEQKKSILSIVGQN